MNTFGESTGTDVTPTTIPVAAAASVPSSLTSMKRLVQNVGNVQERIGHAREVGRAVIERVGHAQLLKASAKRQLGIKLETRILTSTLVGQSASRMDSTPSSSIAASSFDTLESGFGKRMVMASSLPL